MRSDTVPTKRARIKLEQVSPSSHYYRNTSASCMTLSAEIGSGGKESLAASVYVRLSSDPKQRNYLLKKTGKRAVSFKYSARNTKISSKTHDFFITSNFCNKSISIHSDSSCSVVIVAPTEEGGFTMTCSDRIKIFVPISRPPTLRISIQLVVRKLAGWLTYYDIIL